MANLDLIRGRQVVVPLVNRTGGTVIAGDVVVLDPSNDGSFITTVVERATSMVGVVQENIVNLGTGRVLLAGYAPLVNVNASVTRGSFAETWSVAKQATSFATRRSGAFGQYLKSGTTPDAVLWGFPDSSSAGSSVGGGSTTFSFVAGQDGDEGPMGPPGPIGPQGPAGSSSATGHTARVKRSASNFSVGNNVLTAVQFDAEDFDTDSIHDNSTNPSRMTIPTISGVTTGLWVVTAHGYTDQAGGSSDCQFKVNGSTVIAFARFRGDGSTLTGYALSTLWVFTAADYVENLLRTTAGSGNAIFDTAGASPAFSVAFIDKIT